MFNNLEFVREFVHEKLLTKLVIIVWVFVFTGSGSGEESSTDAATTEGEAATTMAP